MKESLLIDRHANETMVHKYKQSLSINKNYPGQERQAGGGSGDAAYYPALLLTLTSWRIKGFSHTHTGNPLNTSHIHPPGLSF